DVFNPFALRVERYNAGCSHAGHKSLGCQADAESANRFSKITVIAHVGEVKFINRRRSQRLCTAQTEQLGAAKVERVKARNRCSALGHGIWVIEGIVIEKVISRDGPPVTVVVESKGALIVPQSFVVGGGREFVRAYVRQRNVLQQILGRGRPSAFRYNPVRKNAAALGES